MARREAPARSRKDREPQVCAFRRAIPSCLAHAVRREMLCWARSRFLDALPLRYLSATQASGGGLQLFRRYLVGGDAEAHELVRAERGGDGDVGGVAAARDQDAADARLVVTGIEGVPTVADIGLEPGAEIHRRGVGGHADVAEIAGAIARRDVHAAAQRHGE